VLSLAKMEISILIDEEFKSQLKSAWLKNVIRQILQAEKVGTKSEVSLVLTGDEKIRELNKQYLKEDRPTDVLSFPMNEQIKTRTVFVNIPDGKRHLGEVIISYPQAIRQAAEHGHSTKREIIILLIHGVLHLLGYDHDIPVRKKVMNRKESAILKTIEEKSIMKVLGIAGSPRRNGNTDFLLSELLRGAVSKGAEVKTIHLNKLEITPCQHCDTCLKNGECRVQDDMQKIYSELERADIIVLASPVQFLGPPAQVKAMIDRCQCLWVKKYVLKSPPLSKERTRRGFLISVGGTRIKNMFEPTIAIVKTWFHVLDVEYAGELLLSGIDDKGAILKHPDALQKAYELGQKLAV
jgi:rRNA maturation RNase YbeY